MWKLIGFLKEDFCKLFRWGIADDSDFLQIRQLCCAVLDVGHNTGDFLCGMSDGVLYQFECGVARHHKPRKRQPPQRLGARGNVGLSTAPLINDSHELR